MLQKQEHKHIKISARVLLKNMNSCVTCQCQTGGLNSDTQNHREKYTCGLKLTDTDLRNLFPSFEHDPKEVNVEPVSYTHLTLPTNAEV